MEKRIVFIIVACILAVFIHMLPKLVQSRVLTLRNLHLFRLADWHERNIVVLVTMFRVIFAAVTLVLLLLAMGII